MTHAIAMRITANVRSQGHQPWVASNTSTSVLGFKARHGAARCFESRSLVAAVSSAGASDPSASGLVAHRFRTAASPPNTRGSEPVRACDPTSAPHFSLSTVCLKVKSSMTVGPAWGSDSRRPDERFPRDAGPLRTLLGELLALDDHSGFEAAISAASSILALASRGAAAASACRTDISDGSASQRMPAQVCR
jgi:hypothetical protein